MREGVNAAGVFSNTLTHLFIRPGSVSLGPEARPQPLGPHHPSRPGPGALDGLGLSSPCLSLAFSLTQRRARRGLPGDVTARTARGMPVHDTAS